MPHERTLPKAKTDRLELLRATRANLDPIWGLSLAGGLSSLLHSDDAEPDATATDEDGFHHSLWRVDDPAAHRRHHRGSRLRARGAGRRPPPLRDRQQLPPRAPRRRHRRSRRRRDHDLDRRARPQPALRARHPPTAHRASEGVDLRDRARRALLRARRRPQRARRRRRARGRDARRRRPRARRPRRPRAAHAHRRARGAHGRPPAELRDVDSARFDAGVLPAVPGRDPRLPQRRADRRGRRWRRATPTPRCCCGRSASTRSAPRPRPICACPRRRRSSRPSRAPAWCSAAWTNPSEPSSTSQVAPVPMSLARSPGP